MNIIFQQYRNPTYWRTDDGEEDGEWTQTLQETVEYILAKLHPAKESNSLKNTDEREWTEAEQSNPQAQKVYDNLPQTTINGHPLVTGGSWEPPFTAFEVDTVFKYLRRDAAPGPDNLRTEFVTAVYNKQKNLFSESLQCLP